MTLLCIVIHLSFHLPNFLTFWGQDVFLVCPDIYTHLHTHITHFVHFYYCVLRNVPGWSLSRGNGAWTVLCMVIHELWCIINSIRNRIVYRISYLKETILILQWHSDDIQWTCMLGLPLNSHCWTHHEATFRTPEQYMAKSRHYREWYCSLPFPHGMFSNRDVQTEENRWHSDDTASLQVTCKVTCEIRCHSSFIQYVLRKHNTSELYWPRVLCHCLTRPLALLFVHNKCILLIQTMSLWPWFTLVASLQCHCDVKPLYPRPAYAKFLTNSSEIVKANQMWQGTLIAWPSSNLIWNSASGSLLSWF